MQVLCRITNISRKDRGPFSHEALRRKRRKQVRHKDQRNRTKGLHDEETATIDQANRVTVSNPPRVCMYADTNYS